MSISFTKGSQRAVLSAEASKKVAPVLPLLRDERRRRPLYFDGRFLAARDLTREQDYFLARQADLGRAGGFGVVSGLLVMRDGAGLSISSGHGVTPSGELVVLSGSMTVDIGQLEPSEAIRARVGILSRIRELPATRTGLYILALRPVEYEANPIAQYPTTLDGERGVHNSDIVEASAITLIPYPDLGEPTELKNRRAHAAKEIFVDRVRSGFVTDALPLAMVAIDRGRLLWVDSHLVRREIGAEAGDILGVSGAPLALREAHILQYEGHLRDVMLASGGNIVASQHFLALPPAGPLPRAIIDSQIFAQRFFPAEIDVDISLVPADEIGALLEEARLLPSIDLTNSDDLESTSVLVVVPVDRSQFTEETAQLLGAASAGQKGSYRRKLPPVAPNLIAKKRPLERLASLPLFRKDLRPAVPAPSPLDQAWRSLLKLDRTEDLLFYVRRRNVSLKPSIVGEITVTPPLSFEEVVPFVETDPSTLPAETIDEGLLSLVESLRKYGLSKDDARRVQPLGWKVLRELIVALTKRAGLFGAAALMELVQAPFFENEDQAGDFGRALDERFSLEASTSAKLVIDVFKAGRPVTEVLLRAGILPELVRPFGLLVEDEDRFRKWDERTRAVEESTASARHAASLRSGLFAILDLQETDSSLSRSIPADLLERYALADLRVDRGVFELLSPWLGKMSSASNEGPKLVAAAALVELARAHVVDPQKAAATATRLQKTYEEASAAFEPGTASITLENASADRVEIIKVVRERTGLGLKEARDLVDAAPHVFKMSTADARAFAEALLKAGAKVSLKEESDLEQSLIDVASQLARTGLVRQLAEVLRPRSLGERSDIVQKLANTAAEAAQEGADPVEKLTSFISSDLLGGHA